MNIQESYVKTTFLFICEKKLVEKGKIREFLKQQQTNLLNACMMEIFIYIIMKNFGYKKLTKNKIAGVK